MSEGPRFQFGPTYMLASRLVDVLAPECERIEIAGSLRRKKLTVGDVEIVLIPKPVVVKRPVNPTGPQPDLFFQKPAEPEWVETVEFGHRRIERRLVEYGFAFKCNGPLLKRVYKPTNPELQFEVFLTTAEKWGVVYTIRTGSAFFAHKLVTARSEGGMCPSNMGVEDGRICYGKHVWNASKHTSQFFRDKELDPLETPEEADVFRVMGLDWIEPEKRC